MKNATPACVVATENTVWGFTALYCTDNGFYGVMGGEKYEHRDVIYEFDYSGELKNKYKVDGQIETLAVNAERMMYLIVVGKGGDMQLMKADLKSVR